MTYAASHTLVADAADIVSVSCRLRPLPELSYRYGRVLEQNNQRFWYHPLSEGLSAGVRRLCLIAAPLLC